ncbi:MAG: hypothetical protein IT168_29835 [Bryobacterales bacterium]|nr:hypothetical protein [Bryobacterales bacterium]
MNVNIEIPEDLYDKAAKIARTQQMSVADLFAAACEAHVAAWERVQSRARRGDREKFLAVLAKVPDVEPLPEDRLARE